MWTVKNGKRVSQYNFPKDGKTNNWQAMQWVSEFCEKHGYAIVISSTWRMDGLGVCAKCLRNGGLRDGVEIVGMTPRSESGYRGGEIKEWLDTHPEVDGFLIFDDDCDMEPYMDRLVRCRYDAGFLLNEFVRAETIHEAFNKKEA